MHCFRKCIKIFPITHDFVIIGWTHITIIHSAIWYVPKQLAELLGSRLLQWKKIDKDTGVTMYRNRNSDFLQYFTIACIDVSGLMFRLSITQSWSGAYLLTVLKYCKFKRCVITQWQWTAFCTCGICCDNEGNLWNYVPHSSSHKIRKSLLTYLWGP